MLEYKNAVNAGPGQGAALEARRGCACLYNGLTEVLLVKAEVGKKEIQEAVRLEAANARAPLVLGELYLRSNAPPEADKEALEVLPRNPSNVPAYSLTADASVMLDTKAPGAISTWNGTREEGAGERSGEGAFGRAGHRFKFRGSEEAKRALAALR